MARPHRCEECGYFVFKCDKGANNCAAEYFSNHRFNDQQLEPEYEERYYAGKGLRGPFKYDWSDWDELRG